MICPTYFPNHLLIVAKENVTMDEEVMGDSNVQTKRGIAWSLMPHYRDLKVRVAFDKYLFQNIMSADYPSGKEYVINAFLNEFLLEDLQSIATFILFIPTKFHDVGISELLHKRMQERQQECVIWGVDVYDGPLSRLQYSEIVKHKGVFAMSITGSSLKSASIVISCMLKKHESDQRLSDFRRQVEDQIRSSRRNIGFLYCPHLKYIEEYKNIATDTCWEHKIITKTIKKVFPDVTIVGIYDHLRCYGLMSKSDDPEQKKLDYVHSVALMIMSFD